MTAPASPYVGAEPLSHDNTIFGRDREIRDLFFLLSKERIALLYSPSGAGKSSILHARDGLLDQFRDQFDVLPVTRVNTESKIGGANRYTLSMLIGLERDVEEPRQESELAGLSLRDGVLGRAGAEGQLTLIVVDQFEEIVRVDPTDDKGKYEFFRQLGELLAEPTIWALFVLREDFLATLDPYIRQLPTHLKNRYRIDLLKPDQAEKAIKGPAERLERKWDPEAARKLAENLAAETGVVEPMHLQIVCKDIWAGMADDDMSIDPEDVTAFGDVDKVLGRFYAAIASDAAKLGHNNEREIRNWVGSKLVVKGGVRGQVLATEPGLHRMTIELLDKTHLVRREPRRGADWLELAHDRLVPAVTKNNALWFDNPENISDLERRAEQWDLGGRSEDLLSVGSAYKKMAAWSKQNPARVKATERSFLQASRKKAAGVTWRRVLTASSVALAVVAFVLYGNAKREEANAKSAGLQARFSRATLYDERAVQAMEKGVISDGWLYTLGALAEDWPENSTIPDALGRLLLAEIRPNTRWTEDMKRYLIDSRLPTGPLWTGVELRAIYLDANGAVHWVSAVGDPQNEGRDRYFDATPSNRTLKDPIYSFQKNADGYSKDFQGPFSVLFHDRMKSVVFGGDKRVFRAGGAGRWNSDNTVSTIAQDESGIAVAEPSGDVRFLDAKFKEDAARRWRTGIANPMSLALDRSSGHTVAIGSIDGTVAIFREAKGNREKAASLGLRGGSVRALAFLDGQNLVAGTADGYLHFLTQDEKTGWRLLQSAKLHATGIVSIWVSKEPLDIMTGSEDGSIRRTPLTWEALGESVSMLDLFRQPRAPAHVALYRRLRDRSENVLHRRLTDTRQPDAVPDPSFVDSERIYYGREPEALSYAIPSGAFVRKSATEWVWERGGLTTPLRTKSDSAKSIVLFDSDSGFTVTIPKEQQQDRRIRFGDEMASWPAAVAASGSGYSSGRIQYLESYLESTGDGWRIRTPERDAANEHVSLPDYGFTATLIEFSEASEPALRLEAATDPPGIGLMDIPRAGGMALWQGVQSLKLFPVTRSEGPGRRSEHTSGQRRTVYEAVSINGQGATIQVSPEEPLVLEFRWRVEISDRTPDSNCPGCGVQMYVGMKGAARDVPRASAIGESFLKCVVDDSMPPAYYPGSSGRVKIPFKAPSQPGLYYITHLQAWDLKCDSIAEKFDRFSTSPKDAVAAIRVIPF